MRIYDYMKGILGAMGVGEDVGVPEPSWRIEEYLKAIYDKLKEGGGSLPPVTEADNGKVMAVVDGEWEPSLIPIDDEKIEQSVDAWLDDHPEATTTVQDGAITKEKLGSDLKRALNIDVDVSALTWALGSIDANGNPSSATTRIYSELVPVTEGTVIAVSGNTDCMSAHKYGLDGAYLGNNGSWVSSYTVQSGTYFVRVLIRKNSWNGTIDSSEISTQAARCSITRAISENGMTLAYSNAEIGQAVSSVGADVLSGVTWERGTIDGSGADYESTSRIRTIGYIDVSSIKAIMFDMDAGYKFSVVLYDASKNRMDSTPWIASSDILVIPDSANYIRIIFSAEPDAWLADAAIASHLRCYDKSAWIGLVGGADGNVASLDWFNATSVNKKEIPSLASGTTILALGDSITAANDSTGWTTHFATMTGVTIINKAVGGTTFGESETEDSGHWMSTQISNVSNENWSDADLVIVACGTNDYGHGTPLSELKEKVQGAITAIKAKTNVPIVFITPIRRGTGKASEPMQKLPVIAGIISNVALDNECNVIRGFDFPIPTYDTGYVENMTQDGLHPNAKGANVYARSVIGALI